MTAGLQLDDFEPNKLVSILVMKDKKTAMLSFPAEQLVLTNSDVMLNLVTKRKQSFPDIKIVDAPKGGYADSELTDEEV